MKEMPDVETWKVRMKEIPDVEAWKVRMKEMPDVQAWEVIMIKNMTESSAIAECVHFCENAWHMGWHERNGGNLTYRMSEEEIEEARPLFQDTAPWVEMGLTAENLKGEFFITTRSGNYFQNIARQTEESLGIVEINSTGDSYRTVCGLINNGRPTSEFPSHMLIHNVRKMATGGKNRILFHCHPANVIALSYVLPLSDKVFTRTLWQSLTECVLFVPGGVGVVPWMLPGSMEIAEATSELMKKYQVTVWAHHGLFVSGESFDDAFGIAHTIDKAAEIRLKIMSTGLPVLNTITDDNLRAADYALKLNLNQEMLEN